MKITLTLEIPVEHLAALWADQWGVEQMKEGHPPPPIESLALRAIESQTDEWLYRYPAPVDSFLQAYPALNQPAPAAEAEALKEPRAVILTDDYCNLRSGVGFPSGTILVRSEDGQYAPPGATLGDDCVAMYAFIKEISEPYTALNQPPAAD